MKTVKYLLFIPLSVLVFGLVNLVFIKSLDWSIEKTAHWYENIDVFYFFVIAPLFWGTIWGLFKLATVGLAVAFIPASPHRKFSIYTLMLLSAVNALALIVYYWSHDSEFNWQTILLKTIITIFILDFSFSIVMIFAKKENIATSKI